jgi:hypothetical protein
MATAPGRLRPILTYSVEPHATNSKVSGTFQRLVNSYLPKSRKTAHSGDPINREGNGGRPRGEGKSRRSLVYSLDTSRGGPSHFMPCASATFSSTGCLLERVKKSSIWPAGVNPISIRPGFSPT